jgi:AAA domain
MTDRTDQYTDWQPDQDRHESPNGHHPAQPPEHAVRGGQFLFGHQYDSGPALWGDGPTVLWSPGEPLMIAAYQGLGKTTLAGQLTRALIGCGNPVVLGFPVVSTAARVLYLAMDRPKQIRRSLRRQFTAEQTEVLDDALVVWPGPPAADLAAQPLLLLGLAEHHHADIVVVDSLKDAALKLSSDETGAAWNRATQHLLMSGRELLVLHHPRKLPHNEKDRRLTIEDIYGSTWITNGCGSVILLNGEPGDPIIEFRHLKQPHEEVGPFQITHDPDTGQLSVGQQVDLVALVRRKGADGLIAKDAARALFDTDEPSRAQTEKARRKLEKLVPDALYRRGGTTGGSAGGTPATFFLAGLVAPE